MCLFIAVLLLWTRREVLTHITFVCCGFFFNLIVQIGCAGSMAGGVMAFVNCPVELLKVKLQTQYKPAAGALPLAGAVKPVRHLHLFIFLLLFRNPQGGELLFLRSIN